MSKHFYRALFAIFCMMQFCSFAVAQTSRASVSAAEVNGTFRYNFTGKFKGTSNEIKILALGGGKLHVAMELLYPYIVKGELSANIGELDGEAQIKGDTAVYSSAESGKCTITIKFVTLGTIKVSQEGSDSGCGFGHNVSSDGTFKKISGAKPKFDSER
ncbi:hypothetical protein BH10ACI2_BH10ACI2_12550 [soil metagenome]